jgi:hypothetical protein
MYNGIVDVQAADDYMLILTFENQERRRFNMAPYLHVGRFSELRDVAVFKKVSVSFDTVEWENGLDIDPEFLYEESEEVPQPALAA